MGVHILVVTDNKELQAQIRDLLSQNRMGGTLTDSPKTAIRALRGGLMPALVILDLVDYELDALAFVRQMRKTKRYGNIPVLVLTDFPYPDQIKTALEAGANRYLTHMFIGKNLVRTVVDLLKQCAAPVVPAAQPPAKSARATTGSLS